MSDQSAEISFAEHIASERDSLTVRRRLLLDERATIDEGLAEIDKEFAAIDAYEAAKTGKTPRAARTSSGQRPRDGSRREAVLKAVQAAAADGIRRRELIEQLGVNGDKSGEMSISNALTALTKKGQIVRANGRFHAAGLGETETTLHAAAE